jgi:DNA repair protein SbcD/Mre11
VQVITLPWLTRATLLTRPETEGLSLAEVDRLLLDRLRVALEGEIRSLDPDLPTILLGHLMVDAATYGAERFLAVGKGFTIPLALLARPCFDYVALGHVHRHQILCDHPPVVYPGSIERVDFSEEKEEKGYVMVELERGRAEVTFCPLQVRAFRTLEVDLSTAENPQTTLLSAIPAETIQDAIVRLTYHLRADQMDLIENATLHEALSGAHRYSIQSQLVSQLARPRLPELGVGSEIDPIDALQTYLNDRQDLQDLANQMLKVAQTLLQEELDELPLMAERSLRSSDFADDPRLEERQNTQLRLL